MTATAPDVTVADELVEPDLECSAQACDGKAVAICLHRSCAALVCDNHERGTRKTLANCIATRELVACATCGAAYVQPETFTITPLTT